MPGATPNQASDTVGRAVNDAASRPCRRCGGERSPGPTLLTPELLIAARDRPGDPELPAATVTHTLAAAMPSGFARYDLVIVPDAEIVAAAQSIAVEFARHEHRVFWLEQGPGDDGVSSYQGPRPSNLKIVPFQPGRQPDPILTTLEALRSAHAIETALLLVGPDDAPANGPACRARWGWRTAVIGPTEPGALPTVRLASEHGAEGAIASSHTTVDLRAAESWPGRWSLLDQLFRGAWPRATVIVVTIDNLVFTKLCLASVLANTAYPNLELYIVDNGSTDGTPEFLHQLATHHQAIKILLNPENVGFGPANNQALAAASGERFVLLNNDTMVPPGWLSRLVHRLDDPRLGLLGPATNRTCNEAQVAATYQTYEQFLQFARARNVALDGEVRPIRMLAMFCTAFRRSLYEAIGPLDERYAVGMFEDEDYALSAKAQGFAVAWAPDVYIHHAYHASIGKLLPTGHYLPLFRTNQHRFEEKWGICWERHRPPA